MERISFNFDKDGRLRLNLKSFKKKDWANIAYEFERYNINPLLQSIEKRERELFDKDIKDLEEHREYISNAMQSLDTMYSEFVSKHGYVQTGEKSLSKSEMLDAMLFAEIIYKRYTLVGDNLVKRMRIIAQHVESTELSQALENEDRIKYLNSIDNDLQISEKPFYASMTDGQLPKLKADILKYYAKKRGREDAILGFLRGIIILLTAMPGGIIGFLIAVFWELDKYSEKETSDDFDEAIVRAVKRSREKYLPEIYPIIQSKIREMSEYGQELAHKGGNYIDEVLSFMPEKYRNYESCKDLHRILGEGYAENIREAYMVYENELLRKKQEEQIEEAERQRTQQTIAMLNVLKTSIETVGAASEAAYNASEMAIRAQEHAIDARRDAEEASKKAASMEKKNSENKDQLDKLKREVKDLKDKY